MIGQLLRIASLGVGALSTIPIPTALRPLFIGTFSRLAGINEAEAEYSISHYRSIQAFFTRYLKPGLRPIGEGLVSPVDGVLRNIQSVQDRALEQIKGQRYSVSDLLADEHMAVKFCNGSAITLYLSPRHYHHVHAPCDAELIAAHYIRGSLWPVNAWGLANIKRLFCVNERVVFYLRSTQGLLALVMVGATNVGSIVSPLLNIANLRRQGRLEFATGKKIGKGELMGSFQLGSTVVLLTEYRLPTIETTEVRYGATLMRD